VATYSPKLSIGLPVYNGEEFLRHAIDSILGQSFQDFELIISDNASVDSTAQICKEYVRKDSRVRYFRQENNIGAAENFNFLFWRAKGEYFKWAAHDDVLAPDFLEKCINVLEQDPATILCYSKVNRIDPKGEWTGTYDYPMRVSNPTPHIRFADLILINHFCVAVFGVIRRSYLAKTPLIGKYIGSDRNLLAEIGLMGRLYEIPEYLFNRRDHPQASTRKFRHYKRLAWFDPNRKSKIHLPYWHNGFQYIRSVSRVKLPFKEKLKCYSVALRWFWARRAVLIEDFKGVIVQLLPFSISSHKKTAL
jgi:glycosyltransferase involved in cell wall biosynthesis